MTENISLVAVDLDGTCVDNTQRQRFVEPEIIAVMNDLRSRAVQTSFVTARGMPSLERLMTVETREKFIGCDSPYSVECGSRTLLGTGEYAYYHKFDDSEIESIVELITKNRGYVKSILYRTKSQPNLNVAFHGKNVVIDPKVYNYSNDIEYTLEGLSPRIILGIIKEHAPSRIVVSFDGEREEILNTEETSSILINLYFIRMGHNRLSITHRGIDKRRGIIDLSNILDVNLENIFYAGDDETDGCVLAESQIGRRVMVGQSPRLRKYLSNYPEIHVEKAEDSSALVVCLRRVGMK